MTSRQHAQKLTPAKPVTPVIGGRYQIVAALGKGGFGRTFLAQDLHLPGQPQCVVKQLKPHHHAPKSLASARRLFDAEAKALHELGHHPQIPHLLAHFEQQEQFFLVQEFIEGDLLSQELAEQGPLPESKIITLLQEILETLMFVHQRQLIHRDIKPSNLIRRHQDQKIVLIDFGTVKKIHQPHEDPLDTRELLASNENNLSVSIAIGSLGYMPNEQLAGRPCLSSDIFAVGMLAIQALTGIEPKRLQQDLKTSEVVWKSLTDISPELQRLLATMVRYDHRQRYASATEALNALYQLIAPPAFTVSPTAPDPISTVWFERGERNFERADYKEAVTCYDAFLETAPDNTMAWFKRGMALENLADLPGAIAAYERVIQLQPDDYLAWMKLGKALESLGQLQAALTAYEEVTRLQSDSYWGWYDQGKILEQLNRTEEAISAYDSAIRLKPDFRTAKEHRKLLLMAEGHIDQLYQQQNYTETVEACDNIIDRNEADALTWLLRGMALESLTKYAEAALSYAQVIKLQPRDHVTWFKLASVLERLQRPTEAAAAYTQVLKIQPTSHWALYQRGKIRELLEQREDARQDYQRVLDLKPHFAEAKAALIRVTPGATTATALCTNENDIMTNTLRAAIS